MAKTATVHNPTNFEPADYEVIEYLDNQRPRYCGEGAEPYRDHCAWWEKDMELALGPDWRAKKNHCVHCGNGNVRWITAVRHAPTGDVVVFGSDCTARLGFKNKITFKLAQLQSRAEARKIRFTIYNKREAFLKDHPEIADALAHVDEPAHAKNFFVKDVLAKLDKYGSLSDAQVSAVVKSMARDLGFEAQKAAEATEVKGDAPVGRVAVTGVVVSVKIQESDFGPVHKMLVKLENNSRVWVTAPAGVERGDTITVRATWTPKNDDKSFAFGSRPHLISSTKAVQS